MVDGFIHVVKMVGSLWDVQFFSVLLIDTSALGGVYIHWVKKCQEQKGFLQFDRYECNLHEHLRK